VAERRDWDDGTTAAFRQFSPSIVPDLAFRVVVERGPDAGAELIVDGHDPAPVLVGTSPVCALRLEDKTVSRRHLALEIDDNRLRLSDLGSTNGTRVQGVLATDVRLEGGEAVEIGGTKLRVEARASVGGTEPPPIAAFGRYIGASTEVRKLYPLFQKLASSTIPVIIEGETGTGKEMLAEARHECGPRGHGPFVVFDCTAVPPSLMESELFGHERGAFSGAVAGRKGVFEQAHGGTLLIDEIGDLDLALQPKLLRAIERSEFRRVGGERLIHADVRVLSATRRDLDRMVQQGAFRDDLFHRLAVTRVELPPLRRRRGDIEMLAHHFWREMGGASGGPGVKQLQRWSNYPWPGNIRELKNAVARALALGTLAELPRAATPAEPTDARDLVERVIAQRLPLGPARALVIEAFERRYVEWALGEHGGNVAQAAAAAGVARRYFQILKTRFTKG
jgi:two-component system, NtrC family, response regulator HydG